MVFASAILFLPHSSAVSAPKNSTAAYVKDVHDYKATWTQITKAISNQLFDRKTKEAEIKSLIAEYTPKANAAKSDVEFRNIVEEFIHRFGNSHFDFYIKRDQGYFVFDSLARGDKAEPMPNCGAYFKKTDAGWETMYVLNGTGADSAGLRAGDVVLKADGEPFHPVASFDGKSGKDVELMVNRDGKTLAFKVKASLDQTLPQFLDASRSSAKIINFQGKKIGYFHVWTQASNSFSGALQSAVLGELYNTDAFILDDRGGYGGRPEGFPNPFFLPPVDITWKYPTGSSTEHFGYAKPVVMLVDHYSRSAKEIFAQLMKDSHRAEIMGQTSAGNVLGTYPNRLNDWCYLEMPVVDVMIDGLRLEGHGVIPDITTPTGYDLGGKDITLQDALKEAVKIVDSASKPKPN